MKNLIILGAGQYGQVAKEIAEAMGTFGSIKFLDDYSEQADGKLSDLWTIDYDEAFIAMGNVTIKRKWMGEIKKLATLVHPTATIAPSARLGEGCIVEAGAVVCSNAEIGAGTIIMANAVVGHDAKVGACCQLKYNCSVPEQVILPNDTKVECNVVYKRGN